MLQELINLTLPVVIQEIEYVLEEYPEHPYQSAFAMPDLHQKLIAHVLSHVPNHYVVKEEQELSSDPKFAPLLSCRNGYGWKWSFGQGYYIFCMKMPIG